MNTEGWHIIFDGTPKGEWGYYLLPPRSQHPNEVWTTPNHRRYTRTGRHTRRPLTIPSSDGILEQTHDVAGITFQLDAY